MAINAGTAVGYLDLDTSKFRKGFSTAISDLKVFQKESATTSDKAAAIGGAMTSVGKTLTTHVTAPLVAVGAAAVKVTSDFDSGMSKVQAISGATGGELQQLRDKAIEMGAKTKFSASESAEAFQYMAMAGWKTGDMLDGISGIMDLAAASGEELGTVSDIVTDALTAFGLSAKDSAHFADVLAQASSNSNTNVGMMGNTFKYVAPIAGALGYSIEDTAVAIGLMANSGIKAEQAGTSLRAILTRLVDPPKDAAQAMKDLNIEMTNADGSVKPLSEVVDQLRTGFAGLDDSQKATYASMLGGQEAMSGLLAIVGASDEDFNKLVGAIDNSDGAAQRMAETMQDNLGGAMEQLGGALESAGIVIGDKLTPYIRKLAEWITALIEKFNNLSPEMQDLIIKIGLVAAAVGPLLMIFGKIVTSVARIGDTIKNLKNTFDILGSVFKTFGKGISGLVTKGFGLLKGAVTGVMGALKALWGVMLANPITIVIAIIAAVVAAFVYFWNTSEDFRNFWINLWESIKNAASSAVDWIKEKINQIGTFFTETLPNAFNSVIDWVKENWLGLGLLLVNPIVGGLKLLYDNNEGFRDWANNLWETVKEAFTNGWNAIVTFFTETIPAWIESVGQWFMDLPFKIGYALGYAYETIRLKILEWGTYLIETIPQIINNVQQWFMQLPGKIWDALVLAYNNIVLWGQQTWTNIVETCTNVYNSVVEWFSQLPGKIQEFLTNAYNNVVNWGQQTWNSFIQTCVNIYNSVVQWFSQLPGRIWGFLTQIVNNVANWGSNIWNTATNAVRNMYNSIVGWLSNLPGAFASWFGGVINYLWSLPGTLWNIGAQAMNSLWDGLASVVQGIYNWIQGVARSIQNFISGIISGANAARRGYSHALGIQNVPRNNYPIMAHMGEMLLTQEEAKEYRAAKQGNGQMAIAGASGISITGNTFNVRKESDIESIAQQLYTMIDRKRRGTRG